MFERGKRVLVKAYGGKQLDRIVWEDVGKGLLVTTEREYQQAIRDGTEPILVGFPKDDVIQLLNGGEPTGLELSSAQRPRGVRKDSSAGEKE
jgi:hypothetical protein